MPDDRMNAIVEYSHTQAALVELRERYKGATFDVVTTEGMEQARGARRLLRELRVSLEKKRVELKAPALERARLIDSEAKRITAELEQLEAPIDTQIKAEEARKEQEREEKARAERDRIAAIHERISAIKMLPFDLVGSPATEIDRVLSELNVRAIDEREYGEFLPEAREATDAALVRLRGMLTAAEEREAEARKQAEEREALRRQKEEQAAEKRRLDEQRRAQEAEERRLAQQRADQQRKSLAPARDVSEAPAANATAFVVQELDKAAGRTSSVAGAAEANLPQVLRQRADHIDEACARDPSAFLRFDRGTCHFLARDLRHAAERIDELEKNHAHR